MPGMQTNWPECGGKICSKRALACAIGSNVHYDYCMKCKCIMWIWQASCAMPELLLYQWHIKYIFFFGYVGHVCIFAVWHQIKFNWNSLNDEQHSTLAQVHHSHQRHCQKLSALHWLVWVVESQFSFVGTLLETNWLYVGFYPLLYIATFFVMAAGAEQSASAQHMFLRAQYHYITYVSSKYTYTIMMM